MSLNGLDAPQLLEVHNATLNEAGGWFLLKYTSRDEVELLDHGSAGVTEARAAVAQYQDLSPLYGLIMYRRKKVVIKYVPEGTSRLLKARTTVHLQDVLEHYAPYETMVEITSADALSDTTLAAAFPLHTAAPSIKANVLDEITEDAEESTSPKRKLDTAAAPSPASLPPMPGRKISSERWPSRRTQAPQVSVDVGKSPTLSQKSSVSRFLVREESGHQSITQLDTPATSEYIPSEASMKDTASIRSGKSERNLGREMSPPIALNENGEMDFDKYYAELYKPKVRLGPRPVTISDRSKRTQTASVPAHSRPVSTLPAGLHTKTHSPEVVQAQFPSPPTATLSLFPRPPPIPDESAYPPRPSSRGSTRSIPLSVMSVKTSKSTMTPEKLRLMKAMELRKKQMRKSTPTETTTISNVPEQVPAVPSADEQSTSPEKHSDLMREKADSCVQIGQSPIDGKTAEHQSFHEQGTDESAGYHAQPDERHPASEIVQQEPAGPSFNDTPIVNQKPKIISGLERSPALTSLLGDDANHFPQLPVDPSLSQANDANTEDHAAIAEDDTNATAADAEGRNAVLQNKRRGWVEPLTISVNVTPNHENEHNFLSDDEFLEELHSATFQEAKPISLQRSPASPFFPPRRPSGRSAQSARSITSAISGASLTSIVKRESSENARSKEDIAAKTDSTPAAELSAPEAQADIDIRPVSVSSTKTVEPEHSDQIAAPRNRQVSSGISKRIQALAEKSAREGGPSLHPQSDKNSFVNMRKTTLQVPTETNTVEKRPTNKFSVWPSSSTGHTTHSNVTLKQSANRDSVSVTARIVRQTEPRNDPSPAELEHSPPTTQSRSGQTPEYPPMAPILSNDVIPDTEENAVPESLDRSLSPTFSYSSTEGLPTNSRKSFDRSSSAGRKVSGQDTPKVTLSKHTSTTSIASDDSQKLASRTSRFFKRISHIGGGKRKSISQSPMPSVPEPSAVDSVTRPGTRRESSARSHTTSRNNSMVRRDSVPDIPPPIVIGDLNVQFPDTLLWKRRWVEIDHLGNLIFTASRPDGGRNLQRGFVSKFNLTELKQPYVPDIERQMMPHSVLFDLDDGATLSCSGEDSMAQRQLLSLLRTYHKAWTSSD